MAACRRYLLLLIATTSLPHLVTAQHAPPPAPVADTSRAVLLERLRSEKRHVRVSLRGWAPMTGRVEAVDSLYLTIRSRSGVRVEPLAAVDSVWADRSDGGTPVVLALAVVCGVLGGVVGGIVGGLFDRSFDAVPAFVFAGAVLVGGLCTVNSGMTGAKFDQRQLIYPAREANSARTSSTLPPTARSASSTERTRQFSFY
ncbi:MAG: hypothetical protein IBJ19_12660 [Gemmatimonadaceae bacterium]|nr:hypothetical protein [Gemmatimonadaceae bacterium]